MGRKLRVGTATPITGPPLHFCASNKQGNTVITKPLLTLDTTNVPIRVNTEFRARIWGYCGVGRHRGSAEIVSRMGVEISGKWQFKKQNFLEEVHVRTQKKVFPAPL